MEKAKIIEKYPVMTDIEGGKNYAWCSCGQSKTQPWCNGAHSGSSFSPVVFRNEESIKAAICQCKQTKNPPYCDGSHNNL